MNFGGGYNKMLMFALFVGFTSMNLHNTTEGKALIYILSPSLSLKHKTILASQSTGFRI